jgi:2,3-diketo-5-methylthio-1-phosphopentane phosphatase
MTRSRHAMSLKIFVDFDGTITDDDVGNQFFKEFGGSICEEFVQEYRQEKISAQECFRREIDAIGSLSRRDAEEFLARQTIDSSFRGFAEFCAAQGMMLTIVSDGLDYYIRSLLERNGLGRVRFFANTLEMRASDNGDHYTLAIRFPYSDAECTRCACCKRNILLTETGDDDIIVYVGEGYSDFCPAQYADIVFAKQELQRFCQEENISYHNYQSFHDVEVRITELLQKPPLRPRRRAMLKRREAFMRE